MIKEITKITTNNYQNSNNKKIKTIKYPPYIQKSLSSKRTSPIKIQMLNILVLKLLDTFFNIKPKWCHSLKCASSVFFLLSGSDGSVLSIKVNETSSKKPQ